MCMSKVASFINLDLITVETELQVIHRSVQLLLKLLRIQMSLD